MASPRSRLANDRKSRQNYRRAMRYGTLELPAGLWKKKTLREASQAS